MSEKKKSGFYLEILCFQGFLDRQQFRKFSGTKRKLFGAKRGPFPGQHFDLKALLAEELLFVPVVFWVEASRIDPHPTRIDPFEAEATRLNPCLFKDRSLDI